MDADTDHGGHERVVFFCMDHHAVQAIIIQDPVVNSFRYCTLVIDLFIGYCPAGNICVQSNIPFGSGLDDPAIFGRNTAVFTFVTVFLPKRVLSHEVAAGLVITV